VRSLLAAVSTAPLANEFRNIKTLYKRRYVMKTARIVAVSMLVALATAGGALAQAGVVRATIPFAFSADGKVLPAGTYQVTPSLGNAMRIQNVTDNRVGGYVGTMPGNINTHKGNVMVFKKYGNHYFLREIYCPAVMKVSLFRTKAEEQVRQQAAMLNDETEVLVAMR
jgi:hypothetical protein